jgi:Fe-S-cluster-containing hydrogenase component 2
VPYCPAGAIIATGNKFMDEDRCVECYACLRAKICPINAMEKVKLGGPRIL